MGDFTCFHLYFEVNAFKTLAESFIKPVLTWINKDYLKKIQPSYPDIC